VLYPNSLSRLAHLEANFGAC